MKWGEACSRGRRLGRGRGVVSPSLTPLLQSLFLCLPVFSSSLCVHICPRPQCNSEQGQDVTD